jgi:hypothetical protein
MFWGLQITTCLICECYKVHSCYSFLISWVLCLTAIVGDITPTDGIPKEEKSRREQEALDHMCKVLGGGSRGTLLFNHLFFSFLKKQNILVLILETFSIMKPRKLLSCGRNMKQILLQKPNLSRTLIRFVDVWVLTSLGLFGYFLLYSLCIVSLLYIPAYHFFHSYFIHYLREKHE